MRKSWWLSLILLLASIYFAGCKQSIPPIPGQELAGSKAAMPTPKADWEKRWENTLAEARKEGRLSLYSLWRPETRTSLSRAFKDTYGITIEFTAFGRGAELLAKVKAEKRAGLNIADVFGAGNPTLLVTMKPEGLLGSIKPLLILPEVMDPKAWRIGKIPFTDDEGLAISLVNVLQRTIIYNTDLIKEGEITSYKDLLKPQYRGKITLNDPSVTGAGNAAITHLGQSLWGEEETVRFLRQLLREQRTVVQRDNRLHIESVAHGKYPIGIASLPDLLAEFTAIGAPIKPAIIEEDSRITAAAGAMGLPTQSAHPNATIIFVNWILNKEGQSIFSPSFGSPATRIDVSIEGINPLFIPVPGKKYYTESLDALEARGKWLELSRKIIMAETAR